MLDAIMSHEAMKLKKRASLEFQAWRIYCAVLSAENYSAYIITCSVRSLTRETLSQTLPKMSNKP